MKNQLLSVVGCKKERKITTFGRARLVACRDGCLELRGGQATNRTDAKEWISLFMHEAVLRQ